MSRRAWWSDWRWWASYVGRVLLACGVLLLGFVAYQLWGTNIQTARAQSSLRDEFNALLASTTTEAPAPAVPAPTSAPAATAAATPSTTAGIQRPPSAALPIPQFGATIPTLPGKKPSGPSTTVGENPVVGGAQVGGGGLEPGSPLARLQIDRIDLDLIVVAGVGADSLRKGPGHYPETPYPGEIGNAAIAGHRTTYGAPFSRLDELQAGDPIVVTTPAGTYTYRVRQSLVVTPDKAEVLVNRGIPELTLTTCNPKYSTAERLVVEADFDALSSSAPLPRGTMQRFYTRRTPAPTTAAPAPATTAAGAPATTAAPGAPAPSAAGTTAAGAAPEVATTAAAGAVVAGGDDAAPTTADAVAVDESAASGPALAEGWFADRDAWPQVALWGLALTAIALLAWRLSKRSGNLAAAALAIVPFVVVLYFFYENAGRLLPPGF